LFRFPAVLMLAMAIAGCTVPTGLAPGLVARMDAPGAQLDRQSALQIVNQYRTTRGSAPLAPDPALDREAERLARQYAETGSPPARPATASVMRVSAGYSSFAETFSGWRAAPADAEGLSSPQATRAGLGVAYNPNSDYGVYWILLASPN